MSHARSRFGATRLQNGEVLVAGGTRTTGDFTPDSSIEIYSLTTGGEYGGFKPDEIDLEVSRMDHSCSLLETGDVLVAGGRDASGEATSVGELVIIGSDYTYTVERLYDSVQPPRFQHTATQLQSGWILLAGGLSNSEPSTMGQMQSQLFVPRPR